MNTAAHYQRCLHLTCPRRITNYESEQPCRHRLRRCQRLASSTRITELQNGENEQCASSVCSVAVFAFTTAPAAAVVSAIATTAVVTAAGPRSSGPLQHI